MSKLSIIAVFTLLIAPRAVIASEDLRFASQPDISNEQVVFVYRDSIWIAPVAGGRAQLLADKGSRPRNPKFNSTGDQVAYAATVNDNQDVFVVGSDGGPVRRITYHPARDDVVDWSPDGDSILFKSTMESPRAIYNRLFEVSVSGGLPKALELPYVETAALSPDGAQVFFTYLKDFQEEVWKRYEGGRAPDLWRYDRMSGSAIRLTEDPAPDSVPMLDNERLYFLSERGDEKRSNIWLLNSADETARQVTKYTDADVRNPSIGSAGIVYELDGHLYMLDKISGEARRLSIEIGIGRDEFQEKMTSIGDRIESVSVGPNNVVVFEARGDALIYDTKSSVAQNISQSSGSAERFASLSPDGRRLAYQSDSGGEYQLYVLDLESQNTEELTNFKSGFRYRPFWSPDGRYIAFMDQQQTIWLSDTQTGKLSEIDRGSWRYHWDMPQFRVSWSPDSRWLTYSRAGESRNQRIYAYDAKKDALHALTSGFYNDFDPQFDPTGNYIVALGYRSFNPTFGDIDSTFTYTDSTQVSILPLIADVAAPGTIDWKAPTARETVEIDVADIEARLRPLPFQPGRYSALTFINDQLYAVRNEASESTLLELVLGNDAATAKWNGNALRIYDASHRGIVASFADQFLLFESGNIKEPTKLSVNKLTAEIRPRQEFRQMFDDSWRYQRDFFYDSGLHGVDWDAARAHYRELAADVHSPQELTAVVRELHAELAAGHVYVSVEPPYNRSDARNVGLLGVDFAIRDGAYQIQRILRPGVRRSEHRSPLDAASLDVNEGDFILSVNGRSLSVDKAPWAALQGLANEVVELTVADSADGQNARTIRVKAIDNERKLRELVWVEETRKFVDEASNGKIGYIYVPNTGREGQNELMQMYRAQYHKDALIIDERFNTGGALGDRFVELLNRPPLNYFSSRNANDYPLPELAHRGPKAMLINSWSYSGGDGFPFLFKTAGVGPLIGTRTWGGLIGPGMRMSLINGGFISAPPQRVYDIDGNWAEGNEGVRPNIDLQNDPGELAKGNDQQLRYAIDLLLEEIEQMAPIVVPEFPTQMPLPTSGE